MLGLWRMWRYAPYLPAGDRLIQPPWEAADYEDDISGWDSPRQSISENRTRPIHPETMSALLWWSMRFVNDFSSDILRAKEATEPTLDANIRRGSPRRRPGTMEPLSGRPATHWRAATGDSSSDNGNTGLAMNYLAATLDVSRSTIDKHRPSDIAIRVGAPLDVEIRGQIEGEQWVAAIDFY